MKTVSLGVAWLSLWLVCSSTAFAQSPPVEFPPLAVEFDRTVRPLIGRFCVDCHDQATREGELDFESLVDLDTVRQAPDVWQKVVGQLESGEMPPKTEEQPSEEQRAALVDWTKRYLRAEALASAGDPGPVVLRRLSNAEYGYTIRDLTGVASLDPVREFPVDGAAGEGFTNAGAALVMSPALLTKYLDAAKEVAAHAMLLPDGLAFSKHTTRRDWTEEKLAAIRAFYAQFADSGGASSLNLQGVKFNTQDAGVLPLEKYLVATLAEREALSAGSKTVDDVARERGLHAKYLRTLWEALNDTRPSPLLDPIRAQWRTAEPADAPALVAAIGQWQNALWRFTTIGHIGKRDGPTAWQVPVLPSATSQEVRVKLPEPAGGEDITQDIDAFRQLFPAALCYTKIVPVDEVVTLTLFYREDDHLRRLMLDEPQAAELDRLWDELRFVSQEPLKLVDAFEQLWQYATQDADPSAFEPLREPILQRAEEFRQQVAAAEPRQLEAVVDFAQRAWRRPLTGAERDDLVAFYRRLREQELTHESAVRMTLARVLVAPAFLYKLEQPAPGEVPSPVSDTELATRLSYFLWSSAPDDELLALAHAGQLRDPDRLAEQTCRLLGDARARRLAVEFGCQWLGVRDFDQLDEKSNRHFPEFAGLREPMYEETVRFFTDLFQHDGSILAILDADHTFVDPRLAEFYSLPAPPADEWTRVEGIRQHGRGGVLGMATTLAKQSGASRTSPILRGNWVYETLLGEHLPRPPKGVPQLPDVLPEGLNERQLIEQHSSAPACAKCHVKIDHYGFALENFDAIGRARAGRDTKARLPDGRPIEGLSGLRSYLLKDRRDDFVRHFCRKLLGYALGRAVQLSDEPLLDATMAELAANDYRVGIAIEQIVRSPQFRMIRGKDMLASGGRGVVGWDKRLSGRAGPPP